MNGFRIAALALPAASAFLASALWAWKPNWKIAVIGVANLVVIVFLWGLLAGAPMGVLFAVVNLSLSFAFFALGLSMAAGQVVSGLAVVLLCSTLFLAPPVVLDAVRGGGSHAQSRFDTLISLNPWAVLAAGSFNDDLLRDFPTMYRTQVADYVEARPPAWGGVAGGYTLAGLILGAAAWGARRLRRPSVSAP